MGRRFKKIKDWGNRKGNSETDFKTASHNPLYAAQENPDILSDEQAMFPERDFDEERAVTRKQVAMLEQITNTLPMLTKKQKTILAMLMFYTQAEIARRLDISQPTVFEAVQSIKKKIGPWYPKEL